LWPPSGGTHEGCPYEVLRCGGTRPVSRWGGPGDRPLEFVHLDSPGERPSPRGEYGEAGGEGLFSSSKVSESLTHRFAVPPLPQAGEGCCQLTFHGQT